MISKKPRKKLLIILAIIVGIFLIVIFSINLILSSFLEGKINAGFEKNKSEYKFSIDGVGGNIFFGNIRLKGLKITPDSSMITKLKEGTLATGIVIDADIPVIRLAGIGIYDAVVHGKIDIRKIEIIRAKIKILEGDKPDIPEDQQKPSSPKPSFNVDSIYMEGITGFHLGKIELNKNEIIIYDVNNDKELLKNQIEHFEVTNFNISKQDSLEHVFKIDISNAKLELKNEVFFLPGGLYQLKVGHAVFTRSDSSLVIKKVALKPLMKDKFEMAKKFKYTTEIFDLDIDEISLFAMSLSDFVRKDILYIDSVNVNGINVEILKDKRYPFNETARPKLPQQTLKAMKMPMYIGAINLSSGKLKYQEKEQASKDLMTVNLSELNAKITFITSVRDSMRTGKPMKIHLRAKLMEKPTLNVNFVLPLNSRADTFYFHGTLGAASLDIFNPASLPAIGTKFTDGKLNSLQFKGGANPTISSGEMTMLYQDLGAEVIKKDQERKNKFLSWAANSVIKAGNPGKNGKTRVAIMAFERVMYKGFGNFVWKTLQTGITNSVSPVGKLVKEEKHKQTKTERNAEKEKQKADAPEENTSKKKKKKRDRKKKK